MSSRRIARARYSLRGYIKEHLRVFFFTIGRIYRAPMACLLTASAIGITLAMPASLHIALKNISALSYSWEGTVQASLFLKPEVDESHGRKLTDRLAAHNQINRAIYISSEQAMKEFKASSGFGDALEILDSNPLPAVIAVQPGATLNPGQVDQLMKELGNYREVDQVRLDQAWLERLHAIIDITRLCMEIIAVLLALAVIIIVGNTIRLDIQNRRDEIEVLKLLGATDAFIRRPFLYTGALYGLAGGLLAWLLVAIGLFILSGPVSRLAGLYESDFSLKGFDFSTSLFLFAAGILLGWLGSWWTVARHIRQIEPR